MPKLKLMTSPSFQTLEYLKTSYENFNFKMEERFVIVTKEDINMLIDKAMSYTTIVYDVCAAFSNNIWRIINTIALMSTDISSGALSVRRHSEFSLASPLVNSSLLQELNVRSDG